MRKLMVLAVFGVLSGCAADTSVKTPTVGDRVPIMAFEGDYSNLASGREFLYKNQSYASTAKADRPRAFVILPFNKKSRALKICKAFLHLPASSTVQAGSPNTIVTTTYWPLKAETAVDGTAMNCDSLVTAYDFEKVAVIRSIARLSDADKSYIVAIDPNNKSFFIDISGASDAQIFDAMTVWFLTAQSMTASGPGTVIQSKDFFTVLATKMCGTVATPNVADAAVLLAGSSTVIGGILIKAGSTILCQKYLV